MKILQQPKVGIISCSGEEIGEGTISRLATLKVLEKLRPHRTVTLCLPLFLAGDEQERAFARFHPTIVVDGCDKGCARKGTEKYSGPVSAALVVSEVLAGAAPLTGGRASRELGGNDLAAVDLVAERIAEAVDAILGPDDQRAPAEETETTATCSCAQPLPVGEIMVGGKVARIAGLPLIFEQLAAAKMAPDAECGPHLLEIAKIYHPILPAEEPRFEVALAEAYRAYWSAYWEKDQS